MRDTICISTLTPLAFPASADTEKARKRRVSEPTIFSYNRTNARFLPQ